MHFPHRVALRWGSAALCLALLLLFAATGEAEEPAADAHVEAEPNVVSLQAGGQIGIRDYLSGFKLAGGYSRWLTDLLWLDLASSVIIHTDTNWAFDSGVLWRWPLNSSKVRPYLRVGLELATLFEKQTAVVLGARVGGGASYYSSPGFGATLEANFVAGPCFGGGVRFASQLDIMVGLELPF